MHRWLGVAVSLNFLIWFLSGIAMMYWDFPSVSAADRLTRASTLDPQSVRVSVADAFAAAGITSADEVRLNVFDGRPVYHFRSGRTERVVYADRSEVRGAISREQVDRIASSWVRRNSAEAQVRRIDDADQWTVQLPLTRLKPLWQYAWPSGEQVYVSQASGEVTQYTTRASRFGAYVGAIPHWLYVTPLRRNGPLWSRIVIGLSGVATIVAALGVTIGIWTLSPSRRYRYESRPSRLPYRGWQRWHAIFGLVVGIAAITWAFSGMLSMDPFPLPGAPPHTYAVTDSLRGAIGPSAFRALEPRDALAITGLAKVKQLECISTSEPLYVATLESGESRLVDLGGRTYESLGAERIGAAVAEAVQPDHIDEIRLLEDYDRYYLDRHRLRPLPVVLLKLSDRDRTRLYVDQKTSRLVGAYNAKNWVTRWLYHGLHSLDFPWLYRYRPLWDVIVGGLMVGGAVLCFTSLVLAWGVVGRTLRVGSPDWRNQ